VIMEILKNYLNYFNRNDPENEKYDVTPEGSLMLQLVRETDDSELRIAVSIGLDRLKNETKFEKQVCCMEDLSFTFEQCEFLAKCFIVMKKTDEEGTIEREINQRYGKGTIKKVIECLSSIEKESYISKFYLYMEDKFLKGKKIKIKSGGMYVFFFLFMISICNAQICCETPGNSCSNKVNMFVSIMILDSGGKLCERFEERFHEDESLAGSTINRLSSSLSNYNYQDQCVSSKHEAWECASICKNGTCEGNDAFCLANQCNGTDCYCTRLYGTYKYSCIDEEELTYSEGTRTAVNCYKATMSGLSKKRAIVSCPVLHVEIDRDTVLITNSEPGVLSVYIKKDTWLHQGLINERISSVKIPTEAKMISSDLNIQILKDTSVCLDNTFYLDYSISCKIIDCIFCYEVFSSANCLPTSYKVFSVIMMILLGCLILAALPCLWQLIYYVWYMLYGMMSGGYNWSKRKLKRLNKKNQDKMDQENENSNDYDAIKNEQWKKSSSKKNGMKLGGVTMMMFFMITIVSGQSCNSGNVISINQPICDKISATTENCTFSFSSTLSIPTSGLNFCLEMKDQNGVPLGNITFSYENRTEVLGLQDMYWTGRWKGLQSSFHGCYNNGWCSDSCGSCCASRTQNGFSSVVAAWPGETQCRRSCGCAACGCFYCVSGCVMQGYSLSYTDSAMKVSRVISREYKPYLGIRYDGKYMVAGSTITSFNIGNFKIDILGTLTGSVVDFASARVISNATHAFLGPASEENSPIQQSIGDIQSSSLSKLTTASPTSFIFDPSIVSYVTQDKTTNYIFKNSGLNNLGIMPSFPMVRSGQVLKFSSGSIVTTSNNPGAIIFTVQSLFPVTFTRIRTTVCPVGTFLRASGCYSCSIGSKATFSLKSSCSAGTITVESLTSGINLFNTILNVNNSYSDQEVSFSTGVDLNFITFKFCGSSDCMELSFNYIASENITIRNDSQNNGTNIGGDTESGIVFSWDDFINSVFSGLSSPYKWIYIIIFVVVIIASLGLIALLSWMIWKMCTSSPVKKGGTRRMKKA